MALDALHDALNSEGAFWKRVAGACWNAAGLVLSEVTTTPNHANRLLWAAEVRDDRVPPAKEMLAAILEDATIAADPTGVKDDDIQAAVNNHINDFATG